MGVSDDACCGLEYPPCSVFMADAVFERFSDTRAARLFRRFCDFLPVFRVYLLKSRRFLQFLQRVAEHFFVRKTVEDAAAFHVDDSNHVRGILRDKAEKLLSPDQPPAHSVNLQLLI